MEVVQLLVEARAPVDEVDGQGNTALHCCLDRDANNDVNKVIA